ncbi:unnamed protein product [Phaeothamnion confervicola]
MASFTSLHQFNIHDALSALEVLHTSDAVDEIVQHECFGESRPSSSLVRALSTSPVGADQMRALVQCGHIKKEQLLAKDSFGCTALETAAGAGALGVVQYLITELGALAAPSLLLLAARGRTRRHWDVVRRLVNDKPGLLAQATDQTSRTTVLHIAAALSQHDVALEVAEFLVAAGADADVADMDGETPLHASLRAGNHALAERLLQLGATDLDRPSRLDSATPLLLAVGQRALSVAKALVAAGAAADGPAAATAAASAAARPAATFIIVPPPISPLCLAAALGNYAMVAYLVDGAGATVLTRGTAAGGGGSNSESSNNGGGGGGGGGRQEESCVHAASAGGHLAMLRFLVERGADPAAACARGLPLQAAARNGHEDCVRWLVDCAGVSPEPPTPPAVAAGATTPLMAACQGGHASVVEFLLARGADVRRRDDARGWSALEWACIGPDDCFLRCAGSLRVVRFLLEEAGAEMETGVRREREAQDGAAVAGRSNTSGVGEESAAAAAGSPSNGDDVSGATNNNSGGGIGTAADAGGRRDGDNRQGGSALHATVRSAWKMPRQQTNLLRYLMSAPWVNRALTVAFPHGLIPALRRPLPLDVEAALRGFLMPDVRRALSIRDGAGRTPLEVALRASSSTRALFALMAAAGADTSGLSAADAAVVARGVQEEAEAAARASAAGGAKVAVGGDVSHCSKKKPRDERHRSEGASGEPATVKLSFLLGSRQL